MKRCRIVILLYYLFLPTVLLAGSLPKAKIGTGFLTKSERDQSKVIFTTNKHLVEGATALQLIVPIIDSSHSIIGTLSFDAPLLKDTLKQYYIPRDDIDLVLLIIDKKTMREVGKEKGLDVSNFSSLPYSFYTNVQNLFAGQPVLFTGYPLSLSANKTKPLLRKGCIAGIDTTRNIIYLDADAYGGSSGSPVFIDLSSPANTEFWRTYKQMLVGIISGYEPFEKQMFNLQTGRIEMIQTENSGIARVVPAEIIKRMADSLLSK
jgi:hypothetical protein